MTRSATAPVSPNITASAENVPYSALLDVLLATVPFDDGIVLTSLPRGSTQITQPALTNENLLRNYSRHFHKEDRIAWECIARQQIVRGADAWPVGEYEGSAYLTGFLRPNGYEFAIAAPLAAPVLDGYPGAVELFRSAARGRFNENDIAGLRSFAANLDRAIVRAREARRGSTASDAPLNHHIKTRLFVFDSSLNVRISAQTFESLDAILRQNIRDLARQRFGQLNGNQLETDRISLPDSRGDLWNFRVVIHAKFPAMGDGPFAFFCVQPECADWGLLRPADFAADQEIARLVPATKFMQEQFSKGPTLQEISRTVHLSPFHFHRRFTELLGITPKHFLLDCQIEQAKSHLVSRKKELSEIARDCGFAHQSHFTSRFKQATGLTPTRWRRLALEQPRR